MYAYKEKKERISTTVSTELAAAARQRGIRFSYALSIGLRRLLGIETAASETEREMQAKIEKLSNLYAGTSARLWDLQQEHQKLLQKMKELRKEAQK